MPRSRRAQLLPFIQLAGGTERAARKCCCHQLEPQGGRIDRGPAPRPPAINPTPCSGRPVDAARAPETPACACPRVLPGHPAGRAETVLCPRLPRPLRRGLGHPSGQRTALGRGGGGRELPTRPSESCPRGLSPLPLLILPQSPSHPLPHSFPSFSSLHFILPLLLHELLPTSHSSFISSALFLPHFSILSSPLALRPAPFFTLFTI